MDEMVEWAERELTEQYTAALRDYWAGDRKRALQRARQLGRKASAERVSLLVLASIHRQALGSLLMRASTPEESAGIEMQAEVFFREALAFFGMPLCGVAEYDEAVTKMRLLNESLERTNQRLTQANLEKDRIIAELKRNQDALQRTRGELEQQAQAQTLELATAATSLRAEISERKLTEIALRESESRFRAIFEKAGIGIALLDKNGRIRECNLVLQEMLGYRCEELHGQVIFELSYPEDIELSARYFKALVEGKYTHYNLDKRFVRKDGSVLWARKIVSGVYGFRGELQFAIDMIENITESKLAEEALRESEARFRQVVDMTCEWIWEQDAEGRYTYSSAAVKDILGFSAEEIIGKHYYDLFCPEDRERFTAALLEATVRNETFHHLINHYRHKDGREVFTESTGTPISDSQGNLLKWRGVDHDVTERKRFEDALRLRDRAIEASSVGIIITDPHRPGNPIIYANPAFIQMTGRPREEVIGRNPRMLQGPETDPQAIEEIRRALQEERGCHLTLKNYRKDGTLFWNELFISPVRDDQGHLTHYVGTQTDVTELRRAEEERHELEIARQIQLSLLPGAPLQVDGALVAGYCLPAVHVGGDYFDYFGMEGAIDVVIADVSGHSVGAAMIMAETRSTLKMETLWITQGQPKLTDGVKKTLSALNDLLFEDLNRVDAFISMFYLKYHTETREISYANAGHNCPLLLRRGEKDCAELDADGLILGVRKGVVFEEKKLAFHAGDVLLLYTDGVTEARNKQGEFFGVSRLRDLLIVHAHVSPQQLIETIVGELGRFCQSRSFEDDISLVVLKAL
jgi:sigma-B regulation protein RsbU (phosphoserine phosphatase)